MDGWGIYLIVIGGAGFFFFATVVYALYWAGKNGHLRNFDKGSRVIFTEEEPEGMAQDFFPGKRGKRDRQRARGDAVADQPARGQENSG